MAVQLLLLTGRQAVWQCWWQQTRGRQPKAGEKEGRPGRTIGMSGFYHRNSLKIATIVAGRHSS